MCVICYCANCHVFSFFLQMTHDKETGMELWRVIMVLLLSGRGIFKINVLENIFLNQRMKAKILSHRFVFREKITELWLEVW
jgi:hypothetical protein